MNLYEVADEISDRLIGTFRRDADGRRPVHGGEPMLQTDPHWRDLLLFYEYFHGDNGAGIGASHQTGWTGHGRGAAAALPGATGRWNRRGWIPGAAPSESAAGAAAGRRRRDDRMARSARLSTR